MLRVIVRDEQQACAHDGLVLLYQMLKHGIERVGLLQHPLGRPNGVLYGGLHRYHHLLDLQVLHLQLCRRAVLHLLAYALSGIPVLCGRDNLYQHRHSNYNRQRGFRPQRLWPQFLQYVHPNERLLLPFAEPGAHLHNIVEAVSNALVEE